MPRAVELPQSPQVPQALIIPEFTMEDIILNLVAATFQRSATRRLVHPVFAPHTHCWMTGYPEVIPVQVPFGEAAIGVGFELGELGYKS